MKKLFVIFLCGKGEVLGLRRFFVNSSLIIYFCGIQLNFGYQVKFFWLLNYQVEVVIHESNFNMVVLVNIVDHLLDRPYYFEGYTGLTLVTK
jgi:hypothetical protein